MGIGMGTREARMKKLTAEECNIDRPCPKCGATDLGEVIPPEHNVDECYGPQGIRWRNHIGIEDPMVYDGVSWWQCSKCSWRWKRFPWSPEPTQVTP